MTLLVLDTFRFNQRLKAAGFSDEQAAGLTEAMHELNLEQLATKADLRELRGEIDVKLKDLQLRLGTMIVGLGGVLIAVKYFG